MRLTFDIETSAAVPGMWDPSQMELTVLGTHRSDTDEYRAYTTEDLSEAWAVFERADVLVGYNSNHFDIPILNRYYAGDLTHIRSLDLLEEIKKVLGRRLKLDSIAKATLGRRKSGSGLDAVTWWAEGKKDKVKKYCLDDVRITKEIYEYAVTNKELLYDDFGKKKRIPLDTNDWDKSSAVALTHTLPF